MFVKGLDGKQVLKELFRLAGSVCKAAEKQQVYRKDVGIFNNFFKTPSPLRPSESLRCGITKKEKTHNRCINDLKPQQSMTFNQRDNSSLAAQIGLRKLKRAVLSERRLCFNASSKRVLHVSQNASVCFRILLTGLAVQLWKRG